MAKYILDVETYSNFWMVLFKEVGSDKTHLFELHEDCDLNVDGLSEIMCNNLTIGFNSNSYDLFMIAAALNGFDNEQLKRLSDEIITSGKPGWMIANKRGCEPHKTAYGKSLWNHIDIINVAPGQASLKIYGGRINAPKMQDLPIHPDATILTEQREQLRTYCLNDLETTELLYDALSKDMKLRSNMSKQYKVDLRCKGGAQVAKAVLQSELEHHGVYTKKPKSRIGDSFRYRDPGFIEFKTSALQEAFERVKNATFHVGDNGQVKMPEELDAAIEFEGARYKFGIGGLHSQEKAQSIVCDRDHILAERDVASMYPNIILGQDMYPESLGPKFLDVYKSIVERRLKAKHEGDKPTSDSLKLVINSSFGLFGSKYAYLYSPELMIQVTITGQLSLLMLIESTEAVGAKVVSANTDGVVSICPKERYADLEEACFDWEMRTGLELEETRYNALYSRDVNSYIAVKPDGSVKGKGAFAEPNLMKNPQFVVINEALYAYLSKGTPLEATINACEDITKFLMVRNVTGGASWNDDYLGKAVRFYYSKDVDPETCIRYAGKTKTGHKVPVSEGARPLMQLPEKMPKDVDRARYVRMAKEALKEFGLDP